MFLTSLTLRGCLGAPLTESGITGCFGLGAISNLTDLWQVRAAWICRIFHGRWGQGEVQLLGTGEVEQEGEV